MWTKRELVEEAFAELALGVGFDISPEEQQTALRRLDSMMATWEGKGIRLGYALPASPNESDLDAPSGLPDSANETVYLNLATRLAPGFGKALAQRTLTAADEGYKMLLIAATRPQPQQLPVMPAGAGNRRFNTSPFLPAPDSDPLRIGEGGGLDFAQE